MANISTNNFLDFTKLTYAEVVEEVTRRLNQDPRFENFRESAISQQMVEIFSACVDMVNYYIERRAEEAAGFDTAQLRSSIIALAKQLFYVVQRPVPAESTMKMLIKGPITGIAAGDVLELPKYSTKFTYEGLDFILKRTYTYTFTQEDVNNLAKTGYIKTISYSYLDGTALNEQGNIPTSALSPIEIIQGTIKQTSFTSDGTIFQTFHVNDPEFSNRYGTEDYSYDANTGDYNLPEGLTKVGVGTNLANALEDDNLYEIDRRSLLSSQSVLAATSASNITPDVCVISTRVDETVEVKMGDTKIATMPAAGATVGVQYFATKGADANKVGVLDNKLNTSNSFIVNSVNLTGNIEFRFNTNISQGANLESIESIANNAPALFYSLDRLVNRKDYITYLKSLTTPIDVKNAIAWGEQEEILNATTSGGIKNIKMFNLGLFSLLGSLYYRPVDGVSKPKVFSADTYEESLDSAILEPDTLVEDTIRAYYNLYMQDQTGTIAQLSYQEGLVNPPAKLPVILDQLRNRAQVTVRHVYMPPLLQEFTIEGHVYVNNMASTLSTETAINNKIYEYLDDIADYAKPVYISKILDIIENDPNVINADVYFAPKDVPDTSPKITGDFVDEYEVQNSGDPQGVADVLNDAWYAFVNKRYTTYYSQNEYIPEPNYWWFFNKNKSAQTEDAFHMVLNQKDVYNELMFNMYNNLVLAGGDLESFAKSPDFQSLMTKLDNTMRYAVRRYMIDASRNYTGDDDLQLEALYRAGNISEYSINSEIAHIESKIKFRYKS